MPSHSVAILEDVAHSILNVVTENAYLRRQRDALAGAYRVILHDTTTEMGCECERTRLCVWCKAQAAYEQIMDEAVECAPVDAPF